MLSSGDLFVLAADDDHSPKHAAEGDRGRIVIVFRSLHTDKRYYCNKNGVIACQDMLHYR
eukprot:COSAG05_NODE_496_length_9256_cov_9.286557_3_plen_60_part_00